MPETNKYIVQFVGFSSTLNEQEFIRRWAPFAQGFKMAGIKTIDLYKISNSKQLTFISRNIWDAKNYFENFPTGIANPGGGRRIDVTQLGGYWIDENSIKKPINMNLLFTNDNFPTNIAYRKRCAETVPYKTLVEFDSSDNILLNNTHLSILLCSYLISI